MNLILFDPEYRAQLLPLVYLRPVADMRVGAMTIAEKWAAHLKLPVNYITEGYLTDLYPFQAEMDNMLINASYLPNRELLMLIQDLEPSQALVRGDDLIAVRLSRKQLEAMLRDEPLGSLQPLEVGTTPLIQVRRPWDIFKLAGEEIISDIALLTHSQNTYSATHESNTLIGHQDQLFLGEGATVYASTLNTMEGPIFIDENATVMEGCHLRGPLYIGKNAVIKMGAKIYGNTAIGPFCKVGGEISNVVFFGYANKGHDGYLGNSVIGEWCNIGAGTDASNLKNNYSLIRAWSYDKGDYISTEQQFCGLIMGDHSKCSIGTTFNSGTVVGISANIYGAGLQPKFIPSFAWGGGDSTWTTYEFSKALDTIDRVYARRNNRLTSQGRKAMQVIYDRTKAQRTWDTEKV